VFRELTFSLPADSINYASEYSAFHNSALLFRYWVYRQSGSEAKSACSRTSGKKVTGTVNIVSLTVAWPELNMYERTMAPELITASGQPGDAALYAAAGGCSGRRADGSAFWVNDVMAAVGLAFGWSVCKALSTLATIVAEFGDSRR